MTYRGREVCNGMRLAVGCKIAAAAMLMLVGFGARTGPAGGESAVPRAAQAAEPDAAGRTEHGKTANTGDKADKVGNARAARLPATTSGTKADMPSVEFAQHSGAVAELLEAIRHRSAELEKREAAIKQREAAMTMASADLEKKIARLESLTAAPGEATAGNAQGGARKRAGLTAASSSMEDLGKIYGAMKAEESAPLLDRLDNETVRSIFAHMKQKQISAVLPLMKPEKAVALTKLLGGR